MIARDDQFERDQDRERRRNRDFDRGYASDRIGLADQGWRQRPAPPDADTRWRAERDTSYAGVPGQPDWERGPGRPQGGQDWGERGYSDRGEYESRGYAARGEQERGGDWGRRGEYGGYGGYGEQEGHARERDRDRGWNDYTGRPWGEAARGDWGPARDWSARGAGTSRDWDQGGRGDWSREWGGAGGTRDQWRARGERVWDEPDRDRDRDDNWRNTSGGRDFFERAWDKAKQWMGIDEDDRERGGYDRRSTRDWARESAGERGRFWGKGPKGYQRSDDRIRDEIAERFMRNSRVDPSDVEVEVKDCEVTLKGTVDSRESKYIAEELADSVMGVKDVDNQLRVKRREERDTTIMPGTGRDTLVTTQTQGSQTPTT